ncbi:MAG TPA: putative lipid II flippase FtsW [Frankiaceae bacterium]|nr:putative lipid II flippase FtsW [Frankiaceae bacterium]
MTSVSEARRPAARPAARARRVPLLARPLTSYYLVTGSALLLTGIGLVMVLSSSSVTSYRASGSSFAVFQKQLLWVVLGLPAMWLAVRIPLKAVRVLAWPLMAASIIGLLLVFVPGIGAPPVNGATRWIQVGSFTAQPSELAKLALILWAADVYARKESLLDDWRHILVPLLPMTCLLSVLIMVEPDMGTTLVILSTTFAMIWVVGAPGRIVALLGGMGAALVTLLAVVEPYRLARLVGFVDPCGAAKRLTEGYQGCQGLYAIGSGGWFGVGLGQSRQKWSGYLPNAHTDFIYAIIGEELGLAGTLLVLVLFGILAYAGVRVAQRSRDPFIRLAATGITAALIVQATVNMATVTGLLPITGIPLPLISFGGSSLGVSLFSIGLLAAFARNEPGAREALAARGPTAVLRARRTLAAFYGFGPAPRRRKR